MIADTSKDTPPLMAGHILRALQAIHGPVDTIASKALETLFAKLQEGGTCTYLRDLGFENKSDLCRLPFVGAPGDFKPVILDGERLYLHRYWTYENKVAGQIRRLLGTPPPKVEADSIDTLVTGMDAEVERVQRDILRSALESSLIILSGGPGTGKTTTVAKIVAALYLGNKNIKFALAAPTGKAAARVKEATIAGLQRLSAELGLEKLIEQVGESASTVHRLLGSRSNSVFFRHNEKNPLPFDLVIIDEASMLELPLFSKLLSAIQVGKTRLILVGDADQLPSVQAGNVLADLVTATDKNASLKQNFHILRRNWRSKDSPAISALVTAVRDNDKKTVRQLLETQPEGLKFIPLNSADDLNNHIHDYCLRLGSGIARARRPLDYIAEMEKTRLLCPHRHGPWGCLALNRKIIGHLEDQGLLKRRNGLPIIINQNDYDVKLFNGDTGVLATENPGHDMMAWFQEEDTLRPVAPGTLPPYEPAFALTIHRSQGSDYENVSVVLPIQETRLLNRQLLYTAVSRARKQLVIAGNLELLLATMDTCSSRSSGLADRLID